jgi:hypothetical protein
MQKQIIIWSMSVPEDMGYRDRLLINQEALTKFHCQCSTCPNPYTPPPKPKISWRDAYGWIACNTVDTPYTWECINDETAGHGKCLSVNSLGKVPTRFLDKNNNAMYALGVLIHCGFSDMWRGSAACITLPPMIWPAFIDRFTIGEKGMLYIIDYTTKSTI